MVVGLTAYAPFKDGDPAPHGAAHELVQFPPESPLPAWSPAAFERALLIVAHPDDEMLFAGGLLLHYPEWAWTLVTVTDPGDERIAQQAAVLAALAQEQVRIESINLGFVDRYESAPGYRRSILTALLDLKLDPDIVFTHGYRGEYGHHCHVWTHFAAHMAYANVWDFLSPCWRMKQLRKTLVREVPTTERKAAIFRACYRQTAIDLEQHAPWITQYQLSGQREFFTQGIVGL